MPQREAELSRKIVKWLNEQPHTIARKRHGTPYGVTGDCDIYGCIDGRHFEIEIKLDYNKPTKLQEQRMKEWAAAGALTGVAYNLDDVKNIVMPLYERMW